MLFRPLAYGAVALLPLLSPVIAAPFRYVERLVVMRRTRVLRTMIIVFSTLEMFLSITTQTKFEVSI